jgi:hypothetical protein
MVSQTRYMCLKKIAGSKGKNGCSINELANSKNMNTNGEHNAIYDCEILAKLLRKFKRTNQMLLATDELFSEKTAYWKTKLGC